MTPAARIRVKGCCELLKISKTAPQCPNQLPCDEYTEESQLSGGEYTRESITNTNNSLKEKSKKFEILLSNGTRSLLMKKTRVYKKNLVTLSL
jgi:hypothetical protein